MVIETARLRIVPLTAEQFRLLLPGVDRMETEMGLVPSGECLDKHVQQAMEYQYQKALSDPDNFIWLTNRQIILKSENKAIASANFKNSPQENACVEIGYGTNTRYRNKGYMTEAVQAMCEWALNQPGVKSVTAETEKDNIASHRVLKKCGFVNYQKNENSLWWKLDSVKSSNMNNIKIRKIAQEEQAEVYNLIKAAFETAKVKDGDEQDFAQELRQGDNYIPEMDLVAEMNNKIAGQIMFTKTYVTRTDNSKTEALLIAPISVLPEYRNLGIGSALIREGFRIAREMGYKAVFLCGDPVYYHRFGFKPTSAYGIRHILEFTEENVMVYELVDATLEGMDGTVDFC